MIRLATSVAAVLLVLSSTPAIAQTGDPTRTEILTALGSDRVSADYVVLLDTSGSMAEGNRYATAVASLGGLFDALPAEDRVALYTFDGTPSLDYQGPALPAPELLGKLPSAPTPNGRTDLGKALEAALRELQRDGAAQVANVVVITDGARDPAPGSPYAGPTGPAWETLHQQAKQKASPTMSVYAVPLGDGSSGATAVKSVFDDATVLTPGDVQNLREYLSRSKGRIEMEKARTVLADDIGKPLEVKWRVTQGDNGATQVIATLTSAAKHVPVEVSNVQLTAGRMSVTTPPRTYRLKPGQSVNITGSLDFRPADDFLLRRTVTVQDPVALHATVRSSWTRALRPEIDLAVDRELASQSEPIALSRTVGSSLFLPLVILIALALIAALLFLRRRRHDLLAGTLVVSRGVEAVELARFPLAGRKTVLDGLPGRGWVTPDGSWGRRGHLKISYTAPPGTKPPVTARCTGGGSLILGGLSFLHIKDGD